VTELPPNASPVDRIGPGTVIREWEVVRFLGRGSYGVVFEARRSSWLDEPHRALKVFDPIVSSAARSALLGEFGALTGVRHPHLLAGIDAFDLTEAPFAGCVVFVLELADEDLSHRVARQGALPPGEVATLGAQVADGLTALHAEGRIHGDVKPENILRAGDRWTLGDFGVSGVLEGSYAVTAGATIDYRPPEFARAPEGTRLHRSADVWALGVTLHVAATGHHPFGGPDPLMRFAAAVRNDRVPAPGLDPTVALVLDAGCLAPDPHNRLDAPTLADHLRAWPRSLPGLTPPAPPAPPAAGPPAPAPPPPLGDRSPTVPHRPEPGEQHTVPMVPRPGPAAPDAPPPPSLAAWRSASGTLPAADLPPLPQQAPARPAPPPTTPPVPPGVPSGEQWPPPPGATSEPQPAVPPAPSPSPSPSPAGSRAWLVAAVVGVVTFVITQVAAVTAGTVVDTEATQRLAYIVLSVALVAGLVVGARRVAPRAAVATLAVAAVVWALATVELFFA
jgi:serine/threonine protein kinase